MMISEIWRSRRYESATYMTVIPVGCGIEVESRVEIVHGSKISTPGLPNGRPPELLARGVRYWGTFRGSWSR